MSSAISFSRVPPRPMAPVSSPPCPGSRRMVFTPRSKARLSGRPRPPLKSAGSSVGARRPPRRRRRGAGRARRAGGGAGAMKRAWICCTGKNTGESEEPVKRIAEREGRRRRARPSRRGAGACGRSARGVVRPRRLRFSSKSAAEDRLLHPLLAVARKPGDHRARRPRRTVMRKHPSPDETTGNLTRYGACGQLAVSGQSLRPARERGA